MSEVITFKRALKMCGSRKPYLLLGNGFSSALYPDIFSYSSLLEKADFGQRLELKDVFAKLGSNDFEIVIRSLETAAKVSESYAWSKNDRERALKDAKDLKGILVQTIANNHPEKVTSLDENVVKSCGNFLSHFNKIYTVNYDLLLYWVLLSNFEKNLNKVDDGFRLPDSEFGAGYRVFESPHSPTFFFLHGGLHLFDSGSETRKYVWVDEEKALVDQVKEAIGKDLYPLFVAEGSSEAKAARINHNGYLSKALRSFESICDQKAGDLFIFGHSLNDTDEHILKRIKDGKIKRVFVGAYKGKTGYSKQLFNTGNALGLNRLKRYPLEIIFFDSASANVWGNNEK